MERVAAAVVVVALGDRKCVKLQRSAILMTPNDMPPLLTATTGAYRPTQGEHGFSPLSRSPRPAREPPRLGALRAARRAEPVDPIHGIGIKNAITN